MNRKSAIPIVVSIAGAFLLAIGAVAEEKGVDWKALEGAKVSLENGLAAAQQKGKPISGKFEMEDGKLQLSVYTAKQGKSWEVIVDHMTGKVSKTEEIKEGEDLSPAKAQSEAMAKAKKSLSSAVGKVVAANAGYPSRQCRADSRTGQARSYGRPRERDRNKDRLRIPRLRSWRGSSYEVGHP